MPRLALAAAFAFFALTLHPAKSQAVGGAEAPAVARDKIAVFTI